MQVTIPINASNNESNIEVQVRLRILQQASSVQVKMNTIEVHTKYKFRYMQVEDNVEVIKWELMFLYHYASGFVSYLALI